MDSSAGGTHQLVLGDVRRLLECVHSLHTAPTLSQQRVLAARLLKLLEADAVALYVADGEGWAVAADAGSRCPALVEAAAGLPMNGSARNGVRLSRPTPGRGLAKSVYVDIVPTVVLATRAEPFEPRHGTMLSLLHPYVAWAVVPALAYRDLPAGAEPVLELMLEGLSEKEIARRLNRSKDTVHSYAKRIYRQFGVRSRPELLVRQNGRPST